MKIALFGYGKMGKEIEQIALSRGHSVPLKIDLNNAGQVSDDDLKACDAAIEFSTPGSVMANIKRCFDAGLPVVVGTTGWYDKMDEVKKQCADKKAAFLWASNFSIGVNIFFHLNKQLAKVMNGYPDYEVTMEEIHHIHKLDAPSGTAISLANQISDNLSRKKGWSLDKNAAKDQIWIDARREGEVPGTHSVYYRSAIDDIEITHRAHNRKGFATGAVVAAEFLKGKKGFFTMEDVMSF